MSALAACLLLFIRSRGDDGVYIPRGGHDASVTTDVRITIYTMPGMKPLAESVEPTTAFTGTYTSLLPDKAYALVFAVDAKREIHWVAPAFLDPNEDPSGLVLEKTASETPFRSSVVFEELADGPLSFFSVVTTDEVHVSDVERLPPEDRTKERLQARFVHGAVREQRTVVVRK